LAKIIGKVSRALERPYEEVIFGTSATVAAASEASAVSRTINTAFVERHNGTDRDRDARRARETSSSSKDWWVHRAASVLSEYGDNFGWPVRTFTAEDGTAHTPARLAKLADHVWTLLEWIERPAVQFA